MTNLQSTYHLRIGIASIASKPSGNSEWYMRMLWPLAWLSMVLTWIYGSSAFVVERNKLTKLKMQTWAIPRYIFQVIISPRYICLYLTVCKLLIIFFLQYGLMWERESINDLIEKAILDADGRGVKVLSLGLLNQVHNSYF